MSANPAKPWVWTQENDDTFRRMWAADATIVAISAAIGCTQYQADRRRKALNLTPRHAHWTPATPRKPAPYYIAPAPRCLDADAAFARRMAGRRFENVILKPSTAPARVLPVSRTEHRGASSLEINA